MRIAKAELWTRNHSDWGWRIYRTRAGLRLLATHALFDPETAAADGVFDALGADPLYRQLCKTQKCFRARLTPKYWRCEATVRRRAGRLKARKPKIVSRNGRRNTTSSPRLRHLRVRPSNRQP